MAGTRRPLTPDEYDALHNHAGTRRPLTSDEYDAQRKHAAFLKFKQRKLRTIIRKRDALLAALENPEDHVWEQLRREKLAELSAQGRTTQQIAKILKMTVSNTRKRLTRYNVKTLRSATKIKTRSPGTPHPRAAEIIRLAREHPKLTKSEIARRTGAHRTTVYRILARST